MCNSRGIKDEEVDQSATTSTIDYSKIALKCIPSKIGRKGDPRMHKALEARLNDPKLSLFEALKIGGFKFHWEDDVSYDADHVLLSQRKNQLSRRIRLFKQNHEKNRMEAGTAEIEPSAACTKRKTENESVKSKRRPRNAEAGETRKNKMKKPSTSSTPLKAPSSEHVLNQESEHVVTTGSLSSMSGSCDGKQASGAKASINSHAFPEDISLNKQNSASQFDPFGSSPLPGSNSNAASLSQDMTPTVITSSHSVPSNLSRAERMNQALSAFSRDSSALMKKCLLQAGFSPNEVECSKGTYIEFGERALENERMLLQEMKMKFNMNNMGVKNDPTTSFVPTNQIQIPQVMNQPNNNLLQNSTREPFGIRELTIMQQQQTNNNAPILRQQNMSNMYFNPSTQQPQPHANNFHNSSMMQQHQYQFNNLRSNVVDLKESEMEDEEWKSILHGSEHTLDKILGLTR